MDAVLSQETRATVVVVDDQPMIRRLLVDLLNESRNFTVIGQAADGAAALALVELLHPQVVLMDVDMPRMNGLAATLRMRERCPDARIVLLSGHDYTEYSQMAQGAGALVYIPKIEFSVEKLRIALLARGGF